MPLELWQFKSGGLTNSIIRFFNLVKLLYVVLYVCDL